MSVLGPRLAGARFGKQGPTSYRDGKDDKGVLLIKCDFHHFDAVIIHKDRMWKQEENHQARCQETEQDRQEDVLLAANDTAHDRPGSQISRSN